MEQNGSALLSTLKPSIQQRGGDKNGPVAAVRDGRSAGVGR